MDVDLGLIQATLGININNFMSGLSRATAALKQTSTQMQTAFSNSGIGTLNSGLNETSKNLKDVSRIVSGILISQAFYRATNAIQDASSAVVGFMNDMEKAQIAMEYFLGTPERAKGFILTMQDFAANTAFSTQQALTLSRRLMGAQFKPEEIKSVMTILNDAAAATGGTAEQMDRIVLALTQMKTNGKIAGQELRQLAEAGIPVYKLLQQELGLTNDQLRNIGKIKISGDLGVAAVLNGLQKRYKGAADRIAETLGGMWETIKDDTLMVSQTLFQAPYGALEKFVRKFRNTMDAMRKVTVEKGLGGLFEAFVPEQLQTPLKIISASIMSITQSFVRLGQIMKPIGEIVFLWFTQAAATVLPVVAEILSIVTRLTKALFEAAPAARILGAALLTLMICSTVAKSMMILWRVTQMGAICASVAKAVNLLTKSIQALWLVASRNPIAGAVMIIAGAFMYLAMSSKTVSAWLDNVMSKLSALMGVDTKGIFNPDDQKSLDDWTKQFNEQVADMSSNLTGVGKSAEKAGKKVKDKFVASFDELYQIPDNLDSVDDALSDIVNTADLPDIKLPDMKLPDVGTGVGDGKGSQMPTIPLPVYTGDGPNGPPMPPINPAPVTDAFVAVKAAFKDMMDWLNGQLPVIVTWGQQAAAGLSVIANPIPLIQMSINGLKDSFSSLGSGIKDFVTTSSVDFTDWATNGYKTFGDWSANTLSSFGSWVADGYKTFGDWSLSTGATFGSWVLSNSKAFVDWSVGVGDTVASWSGSTLSTLTSWSANAASSFVSWISGNTTAFADWVTGVSTSFTDWSSATTLTIGSWIANTGSNFASWISNTSSNFAGWSVKTASTVRSWVTKTSSDVYNWGMNTGSNIAAWSNTAVSNIADMATNAALNMATWINGTAKGVADWVNNTTGNFVAFANSSASTIGDWAQSTWGTMSSWLSGTASGIYDWAKSSIDTIVGWAKSAWGAIKSLASSVGKELGVWSDSASSTISNAKASMGEWVGNNKSWLVPVAATAVLVGGAIAVASTGGAAAPALGLLGLETGGIVDKDQLIRIGEGNKREAVIPLENSSYMRPFSAAVANDLAGMIGPRGAGAPQIDNRPILYVGTLIADDKSLKELERKLEVIRIYEQQRKGLV